MENLHEKFVTTELSKYLSSAEDLIGAGRWLLRIHEHARQKLSPVELEPQGQPASR